MKRGEQSKGATQLSLAESAGKRKCMAVRSAFESFGQFEFAGADSIFDLSQKSRQLRGALGYKIKPKALQRFVVGSRHFASSGAVRVTPKSSNRSASPNLCLTDNHSQPITT